VAARKGTSREAGVRDGEGAVLRRGGGGGAGGGGGGWGGVWGLGGRGVGGA
jgi:hypothetical protein